VFPSVADIDLVARWCQSFKSFEGAISVLFVVVCKKFSCVGGMEMGMGEEQHEKNSQREQEEGNKKKKANIKAKGKGKQKGWQKGLQRIATRKQKESSVRWDLKMGSSFRACFEQNLLPTRSGILDRGPDKREQHQPRATV
jgi:hypothetical protein